MIRFAAVMTLYREQESAAKTELGRRERHRAGLVADRMAMAERLHAAGRNVASALHEQYIAYWQAEQGRLRQMDTAIAEADTAIADARRELAEAHRRRATIEKLRERDARADARTAERRDQRLADDRAARRVVGT